jgi:hypothetical protein
MVNQRCIWQRFIWRAMLFFEHVLNADVCRASCDLQPHASLGTGTSGTYHGVRNCQSGAII